MNDFDPRPIRSNLTMALEMIRDGVPGIAIGEIESALELLPAEPEDRGVQFVIRVGGVLYERETTFTAPPPVGALVLVDGEGGWNEDVKRVWFDVVAGRTSVELGDVVDHFEEGLAQALIASGWKRISR